METWEKPISVIKPVEEAIEKTKILLFKPFNLEKWFIIGFCAWLANLFRQGGGSFNYHFPSHHDASQEWTKIVDFIRENIFLIGVVGSIAVIFIVAISLVLLWLNCRGHFMFVDCLAKNKAQIVEPWKNYKQQANSLLGFRIIVGLVGFFIIIALFIPIGFLIYAITAKILNIVYCIALIICTVLIIILISIFLGLIQALTLDFVVPIMYLKKIKTFAAWKIYLPILKVHFWKTILYLLFKMLLLLAIGTIEFFIVLIGCCFCCISAILLIPYIGTVVFLPFISFLRLYSLCFLRQFGSEYDVFV